MNVTLYIDDIYTDYPAAGVKETSFVAYVCAD